MKTIAKVLLFLSLSALSSVADAKTMFYVNTNTYGSDTNKDIVVNYPNSTNTGSSVNIPGFGTFNNGYTTTVASTLGTQILSIYGIEIANITGGNYGSVSNIRFNIIGNGELYTGINCGNPGIQGGDTEFVINFLDNTIDGKKIFGDTCNTSYTLNANNFGIIGEPKSDGSAISIYGNPNTAINNSPSIPAEKYTLNALNVFDGVDFLDFLGYYTVRDSSCSSYSSCTAGNTPTRNLKGYVIFANGVLKVRNMYSTRNLQNVNYLQYGIKYSTVYIPVFASNTLTTYVRFKAFYNNSVLRYDNSTNTYLAEQSINNSIIKGMYSTGNGVLDISKTNTVSSAPYFTPTSHITNSFIFGINNLTLGDVYLGKTMIFNNNAVQFSGSDLNQCYVYKNTSITSPNSPTFVESFVYDNGSFNVMGSNVDTSVNTNVSNGTTLLQTYLSTNKPSFVITQPECSLGTAGTSVSCDSLNILTMNSQGKQY